MRFTKNLAVAAVGAVAALSGAVASPADAGVFKSNYEPPEYNDYIQCVSSWMYTDFVDPDGNDANLTVSVLGYKNGGFVARTMTTVNSGAHGTFFAINRATTGLLGSSFYLLKATDEDGLSSGWTFVSANCNGTQVG